MDLIKILRTITLPLMSFTIKQKQILKSPLILIFLSCRDPLSFPLSAP